MIGKSKEILISFRNAIHKIIPAYCDATMDAIDALSTNQNANSVTALSENKHFRRKCSSMGKVIGKFLVSNDPDDSELENGNAIDSIGVEKAAPDSHPDKKLQKEIQKEITKLCSPPEKRNFFCLPAMSHPL